MESSLHPKIIVSSPLGVLGESKCYAHKTLTGIFWGAEQILQHKLLKLRKLKKKKKKKSAN